MPTNSPLSPSQRAQSPSIAASTPILGTRPSTAVRYLRDCWRNRSKHGAETTAARMSFCCEQLGGHQGDRDLGARRDQGDVTALLRLDHHIGAVGHQIDVRRRVAERRQRLPRQAEHRGVGLRAQRAVPGFRGFDGVGRPKHQQAGNRPQRGEMLDRLMGRSVLAQSDGVVRHHMDDSDTHQRRQPDRRTAVIGESQERAAVGNEAAMQRDAVHRRRHRVLTNAIVNIIAFEEIAPHRPLRPGAGEVGVSEVGRAPQQVRQDFRDRVDHQLRSLPGRDARPLGARSGFAADPLRPAYSHGNFRFSAS